MDCYDSFTSTARIHTSLESNAHIADLVWSAACDVVGAITNLVLNLLKVVCTLIHDPRITPICQTFEVAFLPPDSIGLPNE